MTPAALLLGQNCTTSVGLAAAGCGSINLLATETRKQRSSISYASLLGCMRCAPVCEVDCERRMACSVGVSVRLLYNCLWMFLWMVETCFFWVVWRRRAAPSGLSWKEGLFICWEMVDWS